VNQVRKTNKAGRPAFEPSDEQRKTVELMAAGGIPQHAIAQSLGVSPPTLRCHFRTELDRGAVKMVTQVADSLFRQAIAGNVSACIFILKTRAGWRDAGAEMVGKKQQALLDAQ